MRQEVPPGADHEQSLLARLNAALKQWPLMMLVVLLVTGSTAFWTLGRAPIYEAKATVIFDPNVPRPLGNEQQAVISGDGSSYWNNKEYYRTQQWVVRSPSLASEVVDQLKLNQDPSFVGAAAFEKAKATGGVSLEDAAKLLLQNLVVEEVKDSRLMVVLYRDIDRERARRVLATLVDTYVQKNLDEVFQSATTAADWLRSQLTALRSELEASEMSLHHYKESKNILSVSMDDQSNMLREEMKQLNQSLTDVRARREHTAARVQALSQVEVDDPTKLPALELIDSPVLQQLRREYVEADKSAQALLREGKGEEHPTVKSALAARDSLRVALLEEVRNIQKAFERELGALEKEVSGLSRLYNQAETRALDLNLLEIEYNRLRRSKENNERLFSMVIERSKETDLTRMLRVNNIRIVDRPQVPKTPVSPNVPLNLAMGLVGGILLGFMAGFAREQMDRTIRTPEDIERQLGLPFLGLLPEFEAAEAPRVARRGPFRRRSKGSPDEQQPASELTSHDQPASALAEAARAIRTNIVFMSPDKPHRTLLVTSGGPLEGKTTVACTLAITMAQSGQRVLLVDCDLRRPRVHKVFRRLTTDVGVTSALIDPALEAEVAQQTHIPNLWVATSGPIPPNPAELLQSEAFTRLLANLSQRFDRVVVDSPPLIPVTDAAVLSTKVDGTVVVVRSARTTRDLARRCVRALRDVGGPIVGVVLNGLNAHGRGYGYYQYYRYQYRADPTERTS